MPTATPATPGYPPHKEALLKRLARIEGPGARHRSEGCEDRYYIDILTQLSAVATALEAVALKVLDEHVKHCVTAALASGDAPLDHSHHHDPDHEHQHHHDHGAPVSRSA